MRLSKSHSSSSTLPYCSSAFADFILKPIKQIGKCIFSRFTSKLLTKKKKHFKAARNASKFSVDNEYPLKNKGSRIMEPGACHVQFLLTIISVSCSGKHSSQFQSLNDLTRLFTRTWYLATLTAKQCEFLEAKHWLLLLVDQ